MNSIVMNLQDKATKTIKLLVHLNARCKVQDARKNGDNEREDYSKVDFCKRKREKGK